MYRPEHDTLWGPCVDLPSPALLKKLWAEFVLAVQALGAPIERALNPGLAEAEIRRQFASIDVDPNPELVAWFESHNGWARGVASASPFVFPGPHPMSLGDAISWYRREPLGIGYGEMKWDPRWFRVLDPPYGIAVRNVPGDADPPLVRAVLSGELQGEFDPPHQIVSLCTWLSWQLDSIDAGAYRWDGTALRPDEAKVPPKRAGTMLLF